tara:strand:- start:593 stop:1228 length:636 start_codon:yes stop_codon:yes gene_type:complete
MKLIIITGPSGSGKTTLSKKLCKSFEDIIVIKTDSYYRDDLFIKILSIFSNDIYDRFISIKNKEVLKTIASIYNKEESIVFYNYDFNKKSSTVSRTQMKSKTNSLKFIILEGIFAHRLDLNYKQTVNIICKEDKEICYERRLKRDQIERKRNRNEVNKRFNNSWDLFFKNLSKYTNNNHVISINTSDDALYKNLITTINELSINKKTKGNI